MLIDLHLLKTIPNSILSSYPKSGSDKVEYVKYKPDEERIYINEHQFFTNITNDIWNFRIGSYKVLEKWLNGKIRETLELDDVDRFQIIVSVVQETIYIQGKIDKIFPIAVEELILPDKSIQRLI
jgi:type ISP restriction-modification system protein